MFQYKNDSSDPSFYFKTLDQMVADSDFVCNTEEFAEANSDIGNQVWRYRYSHRSSADAWPTWAGSKHGDELEYTFGTPIRHSRNYTFDEVKLSNDIITYWTNFVKTGNPNPNYKSNTWPAYKRHNWCYMNLEVEPESPIGNRDLNKRCRFWNKILPGLVQKDLYA